MKLVVYNLQTFHYKLVVGLHSPFLRRWTVGLQLYWFPFLAIVSAITIKCPPSVSSGNNNDSNIWDPGRMVAVSIERPHYNDSFKTAIL